MSLDAVVTQKGTTGAFCAARRTYEHAYVPWYILARDIGFPALDAWHPARAGHRQVLLLPVTYCCLPLLSLIT